MTISLSNSFSRIVERSLNDRCDLYVEQEDGAGGVETVLDREDVPCRWKRDTGGREEEEMGGRRPRSDDYLFVFKKNEDVRREHEIEVTDGAGTVRRFRIDSRDGTQPQGKYLRVYAREVE